MYSVAMDNYDLPMASVFLPADYNTDKKFPVLLWINGGMGGPGEGAQSLADTYGDIGFIYINLPQFKSKIEPVLPDSSNYWSRLILNYEPDNDIIWNSYKIMLDSIRSLVPNIDSTNSFMGGFSNGAHTTAILLNRPNAEILDYFNKFVFVEGGVGLSNYKVLKGKPTFFMQGEKGPDWIKPIYQNAKDEGSLASFVLMEGFGHEFPKQYKETFKKWLLENVNRINDY
jgi:predicted peptidase